MRPLVQTGRRHNVSYGSVRSSVRPSVNTILTIVWKRVNRFCYKLEQLVHGARRWNNQLWGSVDQRSRSQDAEVRIGGLAEASLSTHSVK